MAILYEPTLQERIEKIKQALVEGCIVVTERRTGKTTAILQLLHEYPNEYVGVATNSQMMQCMYDLYHALYGPAVHRIYLVPRGNLPDVDAKFLRGIPGTKLLIDDIFDIPYVGEFYAGVGSTKPIRGHKVVRID